MIPLQSCFSKDGIKGKRKFVATTLYKCLKSKLVYIPNYVVKFLLSVAINNKKVIIIFKYVYN